MASPRLAKRAPLKETLHPREVARKIGYGITHLFGGQSREFSALLLATLIVVSFGLLMVLSSSAIDSIRNDGDATAKFQKQIIFAVVGLLFLTVASLIPVRTYEKHFVKFLGVAFGLQLFAVFFGKSIGGNREWIQLPFGATLQPSEFLKLAVIMALAYFIHARFDHLEHPLFFAWMAFMVPLAAAVSIMIGKDLGTTLIIAMIAFVMVWLAGTSWRNLRGPLVLGVLAVLVLLFTSSSRSGRLTSWLSPDYGNDTGTYAWQSVHGVWALANGGLLGVGIGNSSLKWSWIPEVENDFIFAIIGEELGMVGALFTVGLFLLLGFLIYRIAKRTHDMFPRFICYGVGIWLVLQAIVNISVVVGLLPVLGVPLPMISSGGSSLIAAMTALGVVLSIERQNHLELGAEPRRASSRRAR